MAAEAAPTQPQENLLPYNTSSFEPTVAPSLAKGYIRPEGTVYPTFARSYVAPFHGHYERAYDQAMHGAISLGGTSDSFEDPSLAAGGHPVVPDRGFRVSSGSSVSFPGFDHGLYTGPELATTEASLPIRHIVPNQEPVWYRSAITPKFGQAEYDRRGHVAPVLDMRYLAREELDAFVDAQYDQPVFDQNIRGQYVPPSAATYHKVRPSLAFAPPAPYVEDKGCLVQRKVDAVANQLFGDN